jgi:HAD superfamily hydrolase (TIGR01509 family)
MLEALIFDVDGTLADTERDGHRVAFNLAFKDEGLDWDWSEQIYGELLAVTGGKERIKYYLERYQPSVPETADLPAYIAGLHAAKTAHYVRMMSEGLIPLRPGVERLIVEAKQSGMRLAIATTTTPANVEALLTSTLGEDAMSWFDVIAAGDIVPAKKPAADIYIWALDQLGLAPEQCIAFEDSRNGVLSSLGAGLKTIITVNGYTQEDDFSGARLVLDQMGESDAPFRVIEGDAFGAQQLDLALIRKVHAD